MTIPDYQTLMLPVLRLAAEAEIRVADVAERIADDLGFPQKERDEMLSWRCVQPYADCSSDIAVGEWDLMIFIHDHPEKLVCGDEQVCGSRFSCTSHAGA
ncbi:hypothetical protein [Rhizobium sp. FKY42]|uniref:hypothetical protein n=1 Tax=Rhizobium sp. FKY42 TaxID=2562310 RepID=UPI00197E2FBC|nr:hypothetical protein [Rhizobium sp. FKY42]